MDQPMPPMTPDAAELYIFNQFAGSGFLKLPVGGEVEPQAAKMALLRAIVQEWIMLVDVTSEATVYNGKIIKVPHRVFMMTEAGRKRLGELRVGAKG